MADPHRSERPRTAEERAAFRAWVRAHHPDVGGDPEEFAAGLRSFRRPARHGRAAVSVVRRRRWPASAVSRWRRRRRRARVLR
ncbi:MULTISPECIES: hypothetical protein [Actinomadura]|uniref:DUF3040 domain-containing protein n=1 Tax=Actinomadura yumaensis TaxID=111807 RepID=A0ABW2D082_9ACTN|nr:hypothetical protein [Actinomadura sp. J1-007]MWK36458.1 hypothetical protein [Actinomadura sp. J1-007]